MEFPAVVSTSSRPNKYRKVAFASLPVATSGDLPPPQNGGGDPAAGEKDAAILQQSLQVRPRYCCVNSGFWERELAEIRLLCWRVRTQLPRWWVIIQLPDPGTISWPFFPQNWGVTLKQKITPQRIRNIHAFFYLVRNLIYKKSASLRYSIE